MERTKKTMVFWSTATRHHRSNCDSAFRPKSNSRSCGLEHSRQTSAPGLSRLTDKRFGMDTTRTRPRFAPPPTTHLPPTTTTHYPPPTTHTCTTPHTRILPHAHPRPSHRPSRHTSWKFRNSLEPVPSLRRNYCTKIWGEGRHPTLRYGRMHDRMIA